MRSRGNYTGISNSLQAAVQEEKCFLPLVPLTGWEYSTRKAKNFRGIKENKQAHFPYTPRHGLWFYFIHPVKQGATIMYMGAYSYSWMPVLFRFPWKPERKGGRDLKFVWRVMFQVLRDSQSNWWCSQLDKVSSYYLRRAEDCVRN